MVDHNSSNTAVNDCSTLRALTKAPVGYPMVSLSQAHFSALMPAILQAKKHILTLTALILGPLVALHAAGSEPSSSRVGLLSEPDSPWDKAPAGVIDVEPAQRESSVPRHVKVYHQPGRFGGWPANHGIWSWGNEILVGFSAGYFQDHGPERHAIDHDKPEEHLLARSRDGGETWMIENPAASGALIPVGKALHGITPPGLKEKPWRNCPGGIDGTKHWIETYRSRDDGQSWALDKVPAADLGEGNPASLIRLADGRLCMAYGHRAAPFSIKARLSRDGGRTWDREIILRQDGGGRDLGYPRSVQRPDGEVVTVYYFWDQKTGPERYIAATIWDPS
jgi:hypothetical protein